MRIGSERGAGVGISRRFGAYISPLSMVALLALFTALNGRFLSELNLRNLLNDMAPLLAVSLGMAFVLVIGSIDLSVGSICSCSAVLVALLVPRIGPLAYLAALGFGIVAGAINGLVFTVVKIPSFIATLGAMSVWQSAAYLLSGGAPLLIPPRVWGQFAWTKLRLGILTMPIIAALALLALLYLVQRKTVFGKSAYAIGANERAARLAGIDVFSTKTLSFIICGELSAIAGILLAAKLMSGIPTVGEPMTLMGIAAAALGGVSLSGGKGNALGALLGVALVIVIQNGMNLAAVDAFWQQIVFGSLVIGALFVTIDRKGRNRIVK